MRTTPSVNMDRCSEGKWLRLRLSHVRAVLTCLALVATCTTVSCSDGTLPYEEDEELDLETEPASRTPEVAGARIEPEPGTELADGIVLEEASAQEGDLVEESFSPRTGRRYSEGRRCLLITGQLRNTSTEARDIDMWVDGYSAKGERVASTLMSETQPGHLHLTVPAGAGREFEVYLEWPSQLSSPQFTTAGEGVAVPPSYARGQALNLAIKPTPEAFIAEGIRLDQASACVAALEHSSYTVPSGKWHTKGDWCVLISGRIRNTAGKARDVDLWVDGYDDDGRRIGETLDVGEGIPGQITAHIEYGKTSEFLLHLEASEATESVRLFAFTYAGNPPS